MTGTREHPRIALIYSVPCLSLAQLRYELLELL
jgi:hypothetical protein